MEATRKLEPRLFETKIKACHCSEPGFPSPAGGYVETKGVGVVPELPRMYTADESGTITLYNTAQPPTVSYRAVNEISQFLEKAFSIVFSFGVSAFPLVGALSECCENSSELSTF